MAHPIDAWWRRAVVYQIYVRSFADSDGDGIGDLPGITDRLPYLCDLGVDAVWITPFYPSPQRDHGYDVADYCDVDPLFGTLADADALLARAHELGLRVIVDLVPNHTSSEHRWFREALAAEPGSDARARYLFRTGRAGGEEPPNNWRSVFGGPAWTRVGDTDQWYLHLFDTQPAGPRLDPPRRGGAVRRRLPVLAGPRRRRLPRRCRPWAGQGGRTPRPGRHRCRAGRRGGRRELLDVPYADEPMWDQPGVHEIYRRWHRILDEYDGDRIAVAEAWTRSAEAMARYVRDDEMHQAFNFHWMLADWSAAALGRVVEETLAALAEVGGEPTWVLSNHDVPRHPTRYGGGPVGLARARAATLVSLALPGSAYLYQGEELGLEDVDVAPGAPPGPVLVPDRQVRAGRLPGAAPVGGRPAAVRVRAGHRPAVDPAAARLGGAHGRRPAGRPGLHAGVLPEGARRAARARGRRRRRGHGRARGGRADPAPRRADGGAQLRRDAGADAAR